MIPKFPVSQNGPEDATPKLFLPDGSRYRRPHDSAVGTSRDACKQKIVVTGAFPLASSDRDAHIETIRDPENPECLAFLIWESGKAEVVSQIQREGKIFVPPDPRANSFPLLSLPNGLLPCGEANELATAIESTISKYVKLSSEELQMASSIVLASWFPDCFEAAPYLCIVGPLGSAKTKFLKLLRCFCRRGLIAGDIRSGSLYKLVDAWEPTLIIDELELRNSAESAEFFRLLRTGSVPGVPVFRNGQRYSPYGLKIIASRQPLGDSAFSSRALVISLLPTEEDTLPLGEDAMQQVENEFQAKLCMFRLKNFTAVKNFSLPPDVLRGLTGRTKQIARALTAPMLGDAERTSKVLTILDNFDDEARTERALEPEWLVAVACFQTCHQGMGTGRIVSEMLVGGVSDMVNNTLSLHSENFSLSAKKVGLVLRSLGLQTEQLGSLGRGLRLTSGLKRKIHAVAQRLGIDRRSIAPLSGLEYGAGGAPCALCEEFGLTGGLLFVDRFPEENRRPQKNRPPL